MAYRKGARVLVLPLLALVAVGCGEQRADTSFTNPEWRSSMRGSVTFPLPAELTVTVGLSSRMPRPEEGNLSLEVLRKRTNVRLQFVGLPESPGDVELGQMIREGKLPDVVPESRIDLGDGWARRLFVNVLEFPALTPNFLARIRDDAELRREILARTTGERQLYSLGACHPDTDPFAGVLAYRRDVFDQRGLATSSWEEITASLVALKRDSLSRTPFGGFFDTILALMPSWFGSGYDPGSLVYYDPGRSNWFFGPDEEGFRDFVAFLADLNQRGILSQDVFVGREDMTSRSLSTEAALMAPWRGATGPFFPFAGGGYGKLTEEGEWDGSGAWVESLPLPARSGGPARAGASLYSRVGPGWLVYNQSPRASEALALLDLMYDPEVSLLMALGPEGTAWEGSDGKLRLTGTLPESYRAGGKAAVKKALATQGTRVGWDLGGLDWSYAEAFGPPESPAYRYYRAHDLAANRPGIELAMQPGVRLPVDSAFREARADTVVALQTAVESGVANFVIGRKSMAGFDAFRAELAKIGSGKLLELYRTRATLVEPEVLFGRP